MRLLVLENGTIINMAHVAYIKAYWASSIRIEMSRPKNEFFYVDFATKEAREAALGSIAERFDVSPTVVSVEAIRARFAHLEQPRKEDAACSTS